MPNGRETFQGADVVLCAANGIGTAPPAAAVGACGRAGRPGQFVGARRSPADGAPGRDGRGLLRRRPAQLAAATSAGRSSSLEFGGTDPEPGVHGRHPLEPHADRGPARGRVRLARPVRRSAPTTTAPPDNRFGRGARWVVLCEDLPDPGNRVELSATLVDGDGIPAPKVTYRISDDARRATEWSIERATDSLTRGRRAHDRQCDDAHQQPPARHRAHGRRARHLGGRPVGRRPRRAQPRDHRRERLRDRRRSQSDQHDLGARAACRRPPPHPPRRCAGTRAGAAFRARRIRPPPPGPRSRHRSGAARHHRARTRTACACSRRPRPGRTTACRRRRHRCGGRPARRVLDVRPDLIAHLLRALDRELDDPQAPLDDLRRTDDRRTAAGDPRPGRLLPIARRTGAHRAGRGRKARRWDGSSIPST